MTGGTSTPIEDLRDVTQRILELAGTPDAQARAARARRGRPRTSRDPCRPDHVAPAPHRADPRPAQPERGGPTDRPGENASAARCRSSPSSAGPTSARARCSTGSSARGPRSSRTAPGRPATACTATRSGTAGGSWSSTPAGWRVDPDDPIEARVQEQARLAIGEADVIVFVVDAASGMTPADLEAADSCCGARRRRSSWR